MPIHAGPASGCETVFEGRARWPDQLFTLTRAQPDPSELGPVVPESHGRHRKVAFSAT